MSSVCIDYDPLLYTCASIGEQRSVRIVHRASGDEYEFPNRTEFYGHWKAKAGGYLAEWNSVKKKENRRSWEEFDYIDVQKPEPIKNCIHTLKQQIVSIKEQVKADRHFGFTGKGKTFREDVSTIIKYKGNRDGMLRPLHLDELKQYLIRNHSCEMITEIEADDACTMATYEAWQKWSKTKSSDDKVTLAYTDKDYQACAGFLFHVDTQQFYKGGPRFGKLYIEPRFTKAPKVWGEGRMFYYFQIMSGDSADNYCANSANPEFKWGDMKAYNLLKDAKNDKEAWQAIIEGYKTLYPAPRKIVGWRGEEIEVDWLYVLQENATLAHMLRWKGDKVDVKDILTKLEINYE